MKPFPFIPNPAEVELMNRVKAGESSAFEELVGQYKQRVFGFIYRLVPDAAEAEDLAQNVFVQVYKSAARYRTSAKLSTWLFTIARNLCLNELRRRTRHPNEPMEDETSERSARQWTDSSNVSAADLLLRQELEQKIQGALQELPEKQRTALILCCQDELSYDEIAGILGCSTAATKSLIFRGRERMKPKLKPYLETGNWDDSSTRRPAPKPRRDKVAVEFRPQSPGLSLACVA